MRIEGASALVVGGASGLGAATARMLHEQGARVVICSRDTEKGKAMARALGGDARFVRADVTEPDSIEAAVADADADGRLRISVCCAGIAWGERTVGKGGSHDPESFSNVIAVNLTGTFNVLRLAASAMASNEPTEDGERGICVNTASTAAFEGQTGQVAYAASKGGIVSLTLPAARDLAERGIRVVTIAAGLFETPLVETVPEAQLGRLIEEMPFPARLGRPEEFAAVVRLAIENPMLNGTTIRLDGGLRMPRS